MLDSESIRCTDDSPRAVWYYLYKAIENERSLDMHFRSARTNLKDCDPVPNYKVMKQLALRNRLGWLYRPFIILAAALMPALAAAQWVYSLVIVASKARILDRPALHVVPTTPTNTDLIEAALQTDPALKEQPCDTDILTLSALSREIGLSGVLFCIASNLRLLKHILQTGGRKRVDLMLHTRDALLLLMLARYAQNSPTHCFVTDDHYQRWAFLLSHFCRDLRIVQHGFLDSRIGFPNPFGAAHTVYVRDPLFGPDFAAYYRIEEIKVFSPARAFTSNTFAANGLFLASSFPSIDEEIELVSLLKSRPGLAVIVKFHPAHAYDSRKLRLAELATHVSSDELPGCRIFVSHNSFMEFDYKISGIPTFSIARSGGPVATARAIFTLLDQQQVLNHPLGPTRDLLAS